MRHTDERFVGLAREGIEIGDLVGADELDGYFWEIEFFRPERVPAGIGFLQPGAEAFGDDVGVGLDMQNLGETLAGGITGGGAVRAVPAGKIVDGGAA